MAGATVLEKDCLAVIMGGISIGITPYCLYLPNSKKNDKKPPLQMSREMLYHGDIDLDKNEELKIPIAQEVEATV